VQPKGGMEDENRAGVQERGGKKSGWVIRLEQSNRTISEEIKIDHGGHLYRHCRRAQARRNKRGQNVGGKGGRGVPTIRTNEI